MDLIHFALPELFRSFGTALVIRAGTVACPEHTCAPVIHCSGSEEPIIAAPTERVGGGTGGLVLILVGIAAFSLGHLSALYWPLAERLFVKKKSAALIALKRSQ